jgi:hypothetical protein
MAAWDDDDSQATIDLPIPLMGCTPLPGVVNLKLNYTNSAGADASVAVLVRAGWTYEITEPAGGATHLGTYAGGHDHGGNPQSSVFYSDTASDPSVDDIWFNLNAFTQIMVSSKSLKKGTTGDGNFMSPPSWMRNKGNQLQWVVV